MSSCAADRPAGPGTAAAGSRPWLLLVATSLLAMIAVGLAGPNAATPPVGACWSTGCRAAPPIALGLHLPSGAVAALLWLAYLSGAAAVVVGLRRVADVGVVLPGRVIAAGAGVLALASLLISPIGSADHLSYVAYGRIAALGANPYLDLPSAFRAGTDPVVSAVQPPWADTASVYGPVGTATQAFAAWLGAGNLRMTVWVWQVLCAVAYLAIVWIGDALVRPAGGGPARTRFAVLVTLNPVLVGVGLFGAHIDLVAMAFAVLAAWQARTRPWLAGLAAGAALCVKLPYALICLAMLYAVITTDRQFAWRRVAWGVAGALLVVVPGHLWTGAHTYDQTRAASRFTSLSTPWRAVVNAASMVAPTSGRSLVLATVPLVVVAAGWALHRLTRNRPSLVGDPVAGTTLRLLLVLAGGWVLAAPYVLPWYDVLLWVPLATLAGPTVAATAPDRRRLEWLVLTHTTMLALAYVPGRVVGMSPAVETITLGVRSYLSPLVLASTGLLLLRWAWATGRTPAETPPQRS